MIGKYHIQIEASLTDLEIQVLAINHHHQVVSTYLVGYLGSIMANVTYNSYCAVYIQYSSIRDNYKSKTVEITRLIS